jgi:hypothetical protein
MSEIQVYQVSENEEKEIKKKEELLERGMHLLKLIIEHKNE